MNSLRQRLYRLLRRSERYTKTDMVYAASGGFWLTAAQTAASLLSLPLAIAFAHFLTQNEYGIYKYALSIAAVVSVFSLSGLSLAVARASAQGRDGTLMQGFWLSLRSSVVSVGIALAGALYYAYNGNQVLALSFVIIAVLSPLFNASSLFGSFLNGKRDFKTSSVYNTWRNVLSAACVAVTLVVLRDPLAVLVAYFGAYALTGIYFNYYTARRAARNRETDPELGKFSLHLSIINALAVLADRIDGILLFQTIGAAQLAIYSFAETIPEAINRFNKSIGTLALPKYTKQHRPTGVLSKSLLLSAAGLPIVVAYYFAAPYIFALLFPTYVEAVPFSQAIACLLLVNGILPGAYLDAQGAVKKRYLVTVVNSVVRLAITVPGVLLFGLWGAVLARLLSKVLNTAFVMLVCYWGTGPTSSSRDARAS